MKRDINCGLDPSALWRPVRTQRRVKKWDQR
jgi:hypothetical protein